MIRRWTPLLTLAIVLTCSQNLFAWFYVYPATNTYYPPQSTPSWGSTPSWTSSYTAPMVYYYPTPGYVTSSAVARSTYPGSEEVPAWARAASRTPAAAWARSDSPGFTPLVRTASSDTGIRAASYEMESAAGRRALVEVRVPDKAEVWIDGEKTVQTGEERRFSSPPLEAGPGFTYQVKARWLDKGKPVEQTRIVPVEAGKRTQVDFRKPPG